MDQVIRKSSEAALDVSILESYYRLLKSENAVDRKRGRMGLESAAPRESSTSSKRS